MKSLTQLQSSLVDIPLTRKCLFQMESLSTTLASAIAKDGATESAVEKYGASQRQFSEQEPLYALHYVMTRRGYSECGETVNEGAGWTWYYIPLILQAFPRMQSFKLVAPNLPLVLMAL